VVPRKYTQEDDMQGVPTLEEMFQDEMFTQETSQEKDSVIVAKADQSSFIFDASFLQDKDTSAFNLSEEEETDRRNKMVAIID